MSAERLPYEAPSLRDVTLADMTPEQRAVADELMLRAKGNGHTEPSHVTEEPKDKTKPKPGRAASLSTQLVNLTVNAGADLFVDDVDGEPYVTVPSLKERLLMGETFPVMSRRFEEWLSLVYYTKVRRVPSGTAFKDAARTLSGVARHEFEKLLPVYTRVAAVGSRVYLDLGRADGEALVISSSGWDVRALAWAEPFRFVRRKGSLPLLNPKRGRPLAELIPQAINVDAKGDNFKHLVAWLVAALRGQGPFPALIVNGEYGSAKSWACRMLRRAFDPNAVELDGMPTDARELAINARNSYVLGFDNLSHIPDWLSDALSRRVHRSPPTPGSNPGKPPRDPRARSGRRPGSTGGLRVSNPQPRPSNLQKAQSL